MHGTLKGRVRWQVLDERGVPEIPRTPSGVPVGPAEGIEQDNLITNNGLDEMSTQGHWYSTAVTTNTLTRSIRRTLSVGTGSTTPVVTDTALDSVAQSAASSGSFTDGSVVSAVDTVENLLRRTSLVTRVVTMTADRNLTEFGLSYTSAVLLNVRELLRDGVGTPVTVSLLNGKTLRVDHTWVMEIPWPVAGHAVTLNIEEYDAGNNLVATLPYDVTYGYTASGGVSGDTAAAATAFDFHTPYTLGATGGLRAIVVDRAYSRLGMLLAADTNTTTNSGTPLVAAPGAFGAYTPGSFTITRRWEVPVGSGNFDWNGYFIGLPTTGANGRRGWVVKFDDPLTYTKVNTDTFRVGWVSTWARA